MRPSRRLLTILGVALGLTALLLAVPGLPEEVAIFLWVAIAVIALVDAITTPGRGAVSVELGDAGDVFCGEVARMPASVSPTSGKSPAITEARLELTEDLGGQHPFRLVREGSGAVGEIRLPTLRRGLFELRAIWLMWLSRFGLWEVTPRYPVNRMLRVIPNIRPVTTGQIDVTVRSELYGVKDTAARGEGSEFHQLRDFTAGMDSRTIDWKRSARLRDLVAKEMRAERNHQIILCLDNGYLMRSEVAGLARIDHAINASLSMAWAAGLGGDLVGMMSYDAEPRQFVPPQPGRAAFPSLRARMADLSYANAESNHTLAMAHLGGKLNRRSLIVIFSDFADTTTAQLLVENLAVLNRAHVILFVTLRDPDLGAGRARRAKGPDAVAEAVVAADMARERRMVLDRLTRIGVLCLETDPGQLTPRLLGAYLDIKAREVI